MWLPFPVMVGLYWFILVYIGLWHCFTHKKNQMLPVNKPVFSGHAEAAGGQII